MSKTKKINRKALSTRKKAKEIVASAISDNCHVLDLSEVEFVSRSFADEIKNQSREKKIRIEGLTGSVRKVFDIVGKKKRVVS